MSSNKHDAVWQWLNTCPYIQDLFFSLAIVKEGGTRLIPSESIVQEFTDGSSVRYYDCALTRYAPASLEPNDLANIENLVDFEQLGEWVEEQNAERNFPAFPDSEPVQEISVLPNESGSVVAQDMFSCKFMLQFRIEYLKMKG